MGMPVSREGGQFWRSETHETHDETVLAALTTVGDRISKLSWELGRLLPMYENMVEYAYGTPVGVRSFESITVAEIEKCRNQRAGARYAASVNGGKVRVRDLARLIHSSSLSRGSLSSVRSALLRYVKESDEWESLGDGWFRLLSDDGLEGSEPPASSLEGAEAMRVLAKARDIRRRVEAAGLGSRADDAVTEDVE